MSWGESADGSAQVRSANWITAPHEMAADLASLEGEFEQVTVDLEEEKISVLTEAIVLEGV